MIADLLIQLRLSHANHLQRRSQPGTRLYQPTRIISLISAPPPVCHPSDCLLVCLSVGLWEKRFPRDLQIGNYEVAEESESMSAKRSEGGLPVELE